MSRNNKRFFKKCEVKMKQGTGKIDSATLDDKKISIALMAPSVVLTVQYFILIFFNIIGTSVGARVQLLSKLLVGLIFAYALIPVLKRNKTKFVVIYFTSLFIYLLHYLMFSVNRNCMIELFFPIFFMSLPSFIYSLSLREFRIFKETMKKASYIVLVFGLVLGGLIFLGRVSVGAYSMSLSYYMLLPVIVFLDELFNRFSFKPLTFSILPLIVILALGSRGAVLCIIVFLGLKLLRPHGKGIHKKIIMGLGIFGACLIAYIYSNAIANKIYYLLLRCGIRSRTLLLFLQGNISSSSGRERIFQRLISAISERPIIGLGIGGDRIFSGSSYAHNLFLELIVDFGVIIGGAVSLFICFIVIKNLVIRNEEKYSFFIVWVAIGLIPLLVSGSYLTTTKFWTFLGLSINLLRFKK